jgi:hypothetical protein
LARHDEARGDGRRRTFSEVEVPAGRNDQNQKGKDRQQIDLAGIVTPMVADFPAHRSRPPWKTSNQYGGKAQVPGVAAMRISLESAAA